MLSYLDYVMVSLIYTSILQNPKTLISRQNVRHVQHWKKEIGKKGYLFLWLVYP